MLEVVAPFKHFNKLKEFVAMKLPAGFPVRIGWCGFALSLSSPAVTWASRNEKIAQRFSLRDDPHIGCEAVFFVGFLIYS